MAAPLTCEGRSSLVPFSSGKVLNPATERDCVSLLNLPSVAVSGRLDFMLHHGRDVHPT